MADAPRTHAKTARDSYAKKEEPGKFIVRSTQEFITFENQDCSLLDSVLAAQDQFRPPLSLPRSRFGPFRGPDDFATVPAPHLRVVFLLMRMTNTVVSGSGISGAFVHWAGESNVANEEINGPFTLSAPAPGAVINTNSNNGIYQGLAIDACGLSVSYPVQLDSWITPTPFTNSDEEFGRVSLQDTDTLDSAGLYNFGYVIRAEDGSDVSDFTFSGLVSVFCKSEPDFD